MNAAAPTFAALLRWMRDRDLIADLDAGIAVLEDPRAWADEIAHFQRLPHSARHCEACKQDVAQEATTP